MRHSLSTLLLGGAVALALSAPLTQIPWGALKALLDGHAAILDLGRLLLFAGFPAWIAMFTYAENLVRKSRQAHVCSGTQPLHWNDLSDQVLVEHLRHFFPILDSVSIQIRGTLDSIHDPGGSLLVSPRCYLVSGNRIIIFPAVLWKRLQQDTSALGAVVAHELAHFQHRDIEWLSLGQRFLLNVSIVFFANYLLSMYTSIQADLAVSASGFDWTVVQATVVGKSFHFSTLVTMMILAIYVRTLARWREALADYAAIDCQGEPALGRAKLLISGTTDASSDGRALPLRRDERKASTLLTPHHWLLLGAVVVVASTYLVGPLAYLQNHGWLESQGLENGRWMSWIPELLFSLLPYAGFLLILRVIVWHSRPTQKTRISAGLLAKAAVYLTLGGSIGFLLLQIVPLGFTGIFMPDGYDNYIRYDPGPLLISSILGQLGQNAWYVVLALLGVMAAQETKWEFLAWLPGCVWAVLSLAEQKVFPLLMDGWLAPVAIGIVVIPVLVLAYRRRVMSGVTNWLPIIFLATIYWMGLGDVNHLAAVSLNGAAKAKADGDLVRSTSLYWRAVFHAPGLVQPKLELAHALAQSVEDLDEAINVAELAIKSPLLSSWKQRFAALTLAGDLRLSRRTAPDLMQAKHWYDEAEQLWRENSRLPADWVEHMLRKRGQAALLLEEVGK